jgi:hypothetical protein
MTGTVQTGGSNGPLAAGGLFSPTPTKSAAYTATPGDFVPVDSSGGAVTITLPAQPADETNVSVRLVKAGSAVTIAAGTGDAFNAVNGATSLTLSALYQGAILQYQAALGIWHVFDLPGQLAGTGTNPAQAPAVAALTFGTAIAVNAALGNSFRLTLTSTGGTLSNPTNPTDGQRITVHVTQGSGGSKTLSYGTAYDFGVTGSPTLSTAAAKVDVLAFEYNATATKWFCTVAALGF